LSASINRAALANARILRLETMSLGRSSSAARLSSAELVGAGPPVARWGLLGNGDFRRLWLVGFVVFSVRWIELIVVGVFVYQHTGSPFTVALITMARMLPMALFGAVIGALAERIDRRLALVAVAATMLTSAVCLAALAYAGRLAVWHLAVAGFCSGIASAADNPVRRVMIGEVVGSERMGAAMSIDVGANNASRMLGPTIGGLLLANVGIAGAFTISVTCYAIALAAALGVKYRSIAPAGTPGGVLTRTIEGFLMVRDDPRLIGILTVTVIYNVFGWPFTSMIPVIGQDGLHLGAGGIGILASMDGVGSFAGAVLLGLYAKPAHYARLYIGSVGSYLVIVILFALLPNVLLAGTALLLTGLSNAAFSVMQATLIYLAAPAAMRSRMYGVLSVCIGSSPIGFFSIGLLADVVGAPAAITATGLLGLVAMAATRPWWRALATA
jgi:MFS family permease